MGPQELCLQNADKLNHEFVFGTQHPYESKKGLYYRYHSVPSVDDYMHKYSLTNQNAFEMIRENREVKLYFDIEWYHEKVSMQFEEVLASIKNHYNDFFGHELLDQDIMISEACSVDKESYHVIINNGLFFQNNEDIKYFTNYMTENENDERIQQYGFDRGVYTKNRMFRFPFQSKYGSDRVLKMCNGKVKDHLICRYSHCEFKGYYEFDKQTPIVKTPNSKKEPRVTKTTTTTTTNINIETIHKSLGTPDNEYENHDVNFNSIPEMLECLGNNGVDYSVYFTIACICKNEGVSFEIFDNWCRKSPHFTPSDVDTHHKTWDSINRKVGYNIQTLRNMLYYKYPNIKKDRVSKLLDQITEPTINMEQNGYTHVKYCDKYCRPLEPQDTVLRSHLGTGKSTAICNFIKNNHYNSILCITPRVMFAHSIYGDLKKAEPNFKLYKDVPKAERPKERYMVCQLESLSTIRDMFDLIIFDESESNFAQFNSQTMKENFDLICERFEYIMRNAKTVLCADAFVTNRTMCLLKLLRPNTEKLYIENTYQPYKRVCTRVGSTDKQITAFFDKFQEKNPNDRNIIMTGSCKNSINLFTKTANRGKTILINSYSSDSYATKLQDVNAFWGDATNVIYTPSITVGVSYDPKDTNKEFDNLIMHFSVFSCGVRDMFQGSLRARKIKNNTLYYSNFSSYYGEDRPWVFDFDKLMETIQSRDTENKLKPWVKHLWVYNEKELNTNARYHEQLIDRYLLMCGYTKTNDELVVDIPEDEHEEYLYNYEDIQRIGTGDADEIYIKIVKGEASTTEKLQYIRYTFDYDVLYQYHKIDIEIRKSMFKAYIAHKDKILERTRNIVFECKDKYIPNRSLYHDNIEQKRESIIVLKNLLGIKNTFDLNEIPSEKIDIVRNYFNEHVDYIQNTWKLTKNFWFNKLKDEPIENKNRRTIGTLQTIFSSWCGSDFKKGKRTRKRVDGKRVEASLFETTPQPYIKNFIENTKKYIEDIKEFEILEE